MPRSTKRRPCPIRCCLAFLAFFFLAGENAATVSAFSYSRGTFLSSPHSIGGCKKRIETGLNCDVASINTYQLHASPCQNQRKSRRSSCTNLQFAQVNCDEARVSTYYQDLLSRFQGDFDNYNQVLADRQHGLNPGKGGGHENIHCTLVPCPRYVDTDEMDDDANESNNLEGDQVQERQQWVLAAFYFNGNPRQIFRFRMYLLHAPNSNNCDLVRMTLHTLSPELEAQLRQYSDSPLVWWKEVWNVWQNNLQNFQQGEEGDESKDKWKLFQTTGVPTLVSPLEGCDVLWNPEWDPLRHPYVYKSEYDDSKSNEFIANESKNKPESALHATMEAGPQGAIVDSISMIPGKRILIKDELSLWEDEFWINDRGYDPDAEEDVDERNGTELREDGNMPFIYGNQRDVPYKLKRVTSITPVPVKNDLAKKSSDHGNGSLENSESFLALGRVVVDSELEWTLGEEYRTTEVLGKKMKHLENALKPPNTKL